MKYYEVNFHIQLGDNNNGTTAGDNLPTDTSCTQEDDINTEMLMQSMRDIIAACVGETGFETFEYTNDGIKGYVQTAVFDSEALDTTIASLPFACAAVTYDITEAEDKDWNETWENEGFDPIVVGRRCVIHDGRHLPDDNDCDISVEIDARMAFGTGTHETTRMIVSALLDMPLHDKSVLDCGCGTGILGIVALKCGAGQAVGYDIDEWSADNARHNAVINRVDDRYASMLGDASILGTISDRFDVVMANINRNILLEDLPAFCKVMRPGATLIMSGFYKEDIPLLEEKASTLGLTLTGTSDDNGWACTVFRKTC